MYPPELGGAVTIDNEVLMVGNADSAAEVNYTCIVSLEGTALTSTATATLSIGESHVSTSHVEQYYHCCPNSIMPPQLLFRL